MVNYISNSIIYKYLQLCIDLARAVCGAKPFTLFFYEKALNELESRNEWNQLLEPWNTSFDDFVHANNYQDQCTTQEGTNELKDYWSEDFLTYVDQLYAGTLIHKLDVGRINNTPSFETAPGSKIPFVFNHESDKGLSGVFYMLNWIICL